jgi:hypothetical protein
MRVAFDFFFFFFSFCTFAETPTSGVGGEYLRRVCLGFSMWIIRHRIQIAALQNKN